MSRLFSKLVLVLIVFAVFAAGCGESTEPPADDASAPTTQPEAQTTAPPSQGASGAIAVKIGVVVPLTGPVATYGHEAQKGIELAVEETRAAGVIAPEVLIVDNEGKKLATITALNKFIETDQVSVIIGAIIPSNSLAAAERAEAAGVPMVSPASTNDDLTRGKNYVFRVCVTDKFQGSTAADFAYDTLSARRAAILVSSSDPYSIDLGAIFTEAFRRRGGQIISLMSFSSDLDDFGEQIRRLRLKSPDVIFLPANYESTARCISQARAAGLGATFVGTAGWDSPELYTLSGGKVDGNYFTTHFSAEEDRRIVKKFVQNYRAYYADDPGAIAALSYDAAMLVFDAVRRAGSADPQAITDALAATTDFEGASGNFSMDENHNPVKPLVILKTTEKSATLEEVITP